MFISQTNHVICHSRLKSTNQPHHRGMQIENHHPVTSSWCLYVLHDNVLSLNAKQELIFIIQNSHIPTTLLHYHTTITHHHIRPFLHGRYLCDQKRQDRASPIRYRQIFGHTHPARSDYSVLYLCIRLSAYQWLVGEHHYTTKTMYFCPPVPHLVSLESRVYE